MSRMLSDLKISLKHQEAITGYIFMIPFVLVFLVFQFIPIFMSFILSFMNFNSLNAVEKLRFIGLANFIRVFKDTTAIDSYLRSFQFSLIFVTGMLFSSLFMAILLNRKFYFRRTIRTMIYLPYVSNIIAISMVWRIILEPKKGPVNTILSIFGSENLPLWLNSTKLSLPTVSIINIWVIMAFQTIIFLSSLQNVPNELYESSKIDGTGLFGRIFYVTLPMISPTIFLVIVVSIIISFKNYAIVLGLTNGGGPGTSSRVIALNIYEEAFTFNKYSYASAQAVLLFIVILIVTIIQWKGQKKWVHY